MFNRWNPDFSAGAKVIPAVVVESMSTILKGWTAGPMSPKSCVSLGHTSHLKITPPFNKKNTSLQSITENELDVFTLLMGKVKPGVGYLKKI